jgi:hypothetical protein
MLAPTAFIIGQSNSVMKEGFARKMMEGGLVKVLAIKAIGSSASLLANLFIHDIPAAAADYCILDLAVFDMALVSADAFKIEHMERYLASAIVEIRMRRIEPILLLIPPQWLNRLMHPVYLAQQRVAIEHKCHFFDGLRWTKKTAEDDGIDFADAFSDRSHLSPEYSGKIAEALGASITALHQAQSSAIEVATEAQISPVEVVPIADYAAKESIRQAASSIIGLSLVRIDRTHDLQVPIGRCERVCGLVIDSSGTKGKISIKGTGVIVKDLTVRGDPSHLAFVARVVPIAGDVTDLDGKLRMSVADVHALVTEPSLSSPAGDDREDAVYVSHLLVERRSSTVKYLRFESDLQGDISLLCEKESNL